MTETADPMPGRDIKILERLRMDIRLGRHHPRGTASAHLIRRWGFRRVMKHIDTIRIILDRVESEELAGIGGGPSVPMRQRTPFPGDRRRQGRPPSEDRREGQGARTGPGDRATRTQGDRANRTHDDPSNDTRDHRTSQGSGSSHDGARGS